MDWRKGLGGLKQKAILKRQTSRAFAPATSANLAVGFDILGLALSGVGDEVRLVQRADNQLVIEPSALNQWPTGAEKNTASIALSSLLSDLGLDVGFDIYLKKGTEVGSGMGGSASSAVAALVAFNGLLETPLSKEILLPYAVLAESQASGVAHADNVAPSLYGGLVLVGHQGIYSLPVKDMCAVVVRPHVCIETKMARELLPTHISLDQKVSQSRHLAEWLVLLYQGQYQEAFTHLEDVIIEPSRMALWPYYLQVKQEAIQSGAWGVCVSGSGPSMIAFTSEDRSRVVAETMTQSLQHQSYDASVWVCPLPAKGAHVLVDQ